MSRLARHAVLPIVVAVALWGCATGQPASGTVAPRYPNYPFPDVPASLHAPPQIVNRHTTGWRRLQGGDTRGATRDFTAVLRAAPAFYPAETGLGFVALAGRQYRPANDRFGAVLKVNPQYLPAWIGQADALLGLDRDADAIVAMEHVLALDPGRDAVRTRLELVRFRRTQALIDAGRRAREAGRLDDAGRQLQDALTLSPESTMILHELTLVETAAHEYDEAEAHAREAIRLEPRNAEWQAALGTVLEARGKLSEAAAAYARAVAIDPRPEWSVRSTDLRERAERAALPPEFGRLRTATTVTRAQVAALIGIRLSDLLRRAPRRVAEVATDVRTHWAAPWILPVTGAGIMAIYPNHTFQPDQIVRRGDLATIVAGLVRLAGSGPGSDVARWEQARPRFPDLPSSNLYYRAAALAVASGAMTAEAGGQFDATRPVTGAELDGAVARVAQLSGR